MARAGPREWISGDAGIIWRAGDRPGIALEDLQPGDQLRLGDAATVEITKPRTGCERLIAAQGQSLAGLGGHVGMMANVVEGGSIQVGDPVERIA